MSAIGPTVRDGIITDINAAGVGRFGVAFTATAKWFDQSDNTDVGLTVAVLCDGQRSSRLTRKSRMVEIDVIEHVQKHLDDDAVATVDALVALVESLEAFYFEVETVSTIKATLLSSTIQLPTRKMLNKSRRFYAWARLTFQVVVNS